MGFFGRNKEEETENEEEEPATYEITFDCENCGSEIDLEIPFGTIIKDFVKTLKCEECGCDLIQDIKIKRTEQEDEEDE